MFKNITVYELDPAFEVSVASLEAAIQAVPFSECSGSQDFSIGFVPPREVNGALVENVERQYIMKLMIETKTVPGAIVMREFKTIAANIEDTTGRKPGNREKREIKENIRMGLIPAAFPKQSSVLLWINPKTRLLMIDSISPSRLDLVLALLVCTIEGFVCSLVQTEESPSAVMGVALAEGGDFSQDFTVDRECELKASDESCATVRYAKHALDIDEVAAHIQQGKRVTKLAMTWKDRVSFVLTEDLQLRKIALLDGVMAESNRDGDDDAFDADVLITTSEITGLLTDLFDALGGTVDLPGDSDDL